MSWFSEKGVEISENTLIKLYKSYRVNAQTNLDFFYKYRDYFGVLFSVLTSIFVAGLVQFYQQSLSIVLLPIPILMFYLGISGKKTVDRYYKHFLESIAMVAKIENILGLDQPIWVQNKKIAETVWPDDKRFIVDRHYNAGHGTKEKPAERTSKEFITNRMKKGDNIAARNIFTVFQVASIVLIVLLVFSLVL